MATPKQMLLEYTYIGGDLTADIDAMLAEGKSWRQIAVEVSDRSRCKVSHESLRQWFGKARVA